MQTCTQGDRILAETSSVEFFCHFSFPIFNCKIVYWENRKVRLVRASIQSDSTLTVLQLLSDFRALVVCPQTMASAEFRARKSNSNSANSAGFFFILNFQTSCIGRKTFLEKIKMKISTLWREDRFVQYSWNGISREVGAFWEHGWPWFEDVCSISS